MSSGPVAGVSPVCVVYRKDRGHVSTCDSKNHLDVGSMSDFGREEVKSDSLTPVSPELMPS